MLKSGLGSRKGTRFFVCSIVAFLPLPQCVVVFGISRYNRYKRYKDTIDTNLIGKPPGSKNQEAELLALQHRHYR